MNPASRHPASRIANLVSRIAYLVSCNSPSFVVRCSILCPRGAARLPRAKGKRARPVQRALAHSGARWHALTASAEDA